MKILMCHNYYLQAGGEDTSYAQESQLLRERGHIVIPFERNNEAVAEIGKVRTALGTVWSRKSYHDVRSIIQQERPDIAHFTNTFPLVSPAAYYAAHAEGVPVVQSLRNFRLLCPGAYLMRDGRTCEDCIGKKFAWPAVRHKCYRGDRLGTAVVSSKIALHKVIGSWKKRVDLYFALTEFARQKFIQGGLPSDRLALKPNFLSPDPGAGDGSGGYALFVGRLSKEKGLDTLLRAWPKLRHPFPLKIVGDGELQEQVALAASKNSNIEYLGWCDGPRVLKLLAAARCLVLPSIWYEGFPRTIIEAFAKGTPVIASDLGSMGEIIVDGSTGGLFKPGSPDALAEKVDSLCDSDRTLHAMRPAVRQEFLHHYTADRNYQILMDIYQRASARHSACNS